MDLITLKTSVIPDASPIFTSTLVIAGFFGVLLLLSILIIVFNAFGKAVSTSQASSDKRKREKAIMTEDTNIVSPFAPVSVQTQKTTPSLKEEQEISGEIVAAISAAIYMLEGENAVVKSITPIKSNPITRRNPWAMAAIAENTKPF